MPDETTTDVPVVAPAVAEPAVVEPVVIEPVVVIGTPTVETAVTPEVAVTEPTTAEQPTVAESVVAQESASQPTADLNLAPQQRVVEAQDSETASGTAPAEPVVAATPEQFQPVQPVAPTRNFFVGLAVKAHLATQFRKRKRLDHVMDLFAKQANITNDEVEKLLHVSDATASRYLGILEKENKIKQVGAGKYISYTKI